MMQGDAALFALESPLLTRCSIDNSNLERAMMMDKRGEGVPLIIHESESFSGKRPEYSLVGEDLQLTIYASASGANA